MRTLSYREELWVFTYASINKLEVIATEVDCVAYVSGSGYCGPHKFFEISVWDAVDKFVKNLADRARHVGHD